MPNRIIREGILSSEPVASLGWAAEVFYRRLMSIVDDYGRCEANPQLLRSKCYPLHTDAQVSAGDVIAWLSACQRAGLVYCYKVDGKGYAAVNKFQQQQRSASKFPPPPADAQQMISSDIGCKEMIGNEHLGVFVSGGVSVVEGVSGGVVDSIPATLRVATPRQADEPPEKTGYQPPDCPHLDVLAAWAEVMPDLPQHLPDQWKGVRAAHLRARWREAACSNQWPGKEAGIEYLRGLFRHCRNSQFLMGKTSSRDRRPFELELAWLVNPTNWAKVIEGKYHS